MGTNRANVALIPPDDGDTTTKWLITLNSPLGNPNLGVVNGRVATITSDSILTTNVALAYRQAIVVANDLIYLDGEGNRTLEPTNNRQSIIFDNDNTSGRAVALYNDALKRPTTRLLNPSIVLDNEATSGFAVPLYLDSLGQKSTAPTPNRLYTSTTSNTAPLLYYDVNGLETRTPEQPPTGRVKNNGRDVSGTAQYDLNKNAKATIPVYRQELVVGTRPFQMVQTVADAGTDTLTVNAINAASRLTLTDTTLIGVNMVGQVEYRQYRGDPSEHQ